MISEIMRNGGGNGRRLNSNWRIGGGELRRVGTEDHNGNTWRDVGAAVEQTTTDPQDSVYKLSYFSVAEDVNRTIITVHNEIMDLFKQNVQPFYLENNHGKSYGLLLNGSVTSQQD